MQSMNISLPDPLKQFVDGQIAQGRYSSASDYVRELIRADEKRKAEEQLEAKLLEGLSSAETALTPAAWRAIRKEALAKVEARKQRRRCPRSRSAKQPSATWTSSSPTWRRTLAYTSPSAS